MGSVARPSTVLIDIYSSGFLRLYRTKSNVIGRISGLRQAPSKIFGVLGMTNQHILTWPGGIIGFARVVSLKLHHIFLP